MATFAKSNFSHTNYATYRPSYPKSLYETILSYHEGPREHAIDLGCGHGVIARHLSDVFSHTLGVDPSPGMLASTARLTPQYAYPNVSFAAGDALNLPLWQSQQTDAIFSGQAAHWFPYPACWPALHAAIRPGGTVAFFGYKDPVFPSHAAASKLVDAFAYDDDKMGPYWAQPGRNIVQNKLRDVVPPEAGSQPHDGNPTGEVLFTDVQRIEYEPGLEGPKTGSGKMFMSKTMKVGGFPNYVRTWSAFHGWAEANPEAKSKKSGGSGDIADQMLDAIKEVDETFKDDDADVLIEWGTGLLLARRV